MASTKVRGRPPKSKVRDQIQEILGALGVGYGYELYKIYKHNFEEVELRTVYYHLKKGTTLGLFTELGSEHAQGSFTWGSVSTRKYYTLAEEPELPPRNKVKDSLKELGFSYRDPVGFKVI